MWLRNNLLERTSDLTKTENFERIYAKHTGKWRFYRSLFVLCWGDDIAVNA